MSSSAKSVPIKSDFVFMIDATGSMAGEIAGVRNGFSSFVSGLGAAGIDSRFAIVVFGGAPELILDFTADSTLAQTRLNQISIGALAGIQNNHNVNPEAGLEVVRMVLGAAPQSNLVNNNIPEDGLLNFRPDARKNLILATDEDSDIPFFGVNRFAGQAGFGGGNGFVGEIPNALTAGGQAEVDATAQAVINSDAFINLLVNITDPPSKSQYGDPTKDVSDIDFLNFDPALTLANLLVDALTANSLEAQVLGAGLIARTFNVAGANDPSFVNNFFAAKVEETVERPVNGIPEPATLALFGVGLAGIGFLRRRRRT